MIDLNNIEVIDAVNVSDEVLISENCLARVGRVYPAEKKECLDGVLCRPEGMFEMVESCKDCEKCL